MASQPQPWQSNKPPARELTEHWNIRSEDRRRVLSALKDALKGSKVRRAFWAFCQVADISKLQYLVDNPLMALLSQDACEVATQQCKLDVLLLSLPPLPLPFLFFFSSFRIFVQNHL
jgi:hypothetical protein